MVDHWDYRGGAKKLPMILARVRETADAAIMVAPDILVIIDSPDFTHSRRAGRSARAPRAIPIVTMSRHGVGMGSGRARAMRRYMTTCWRYCRSSRKPIAG